VNGGFGDDVSVEAVAKVDGVDIVTATKIRFGQIGACLACAGSEGRLGSSKCAGLGGDAHHSKSLYMIVKKTCKKRLTAFINTASRYNHASPDIATVSRAA
jgi:hypothetical protein